MASHGGNGLTGLEEIVEPSSTEPRVEVLILRPPGSDRIDSVLGLLAAEIVSCTCRRLHVTTAVGAPAGRSFGAHGVAVYLEPVGAALDVAITFAWTGDSCRFRAGCSSSRDVRAIARAVGAEIDAHCSTSRSGSPDRQVGLDR